MINIISIGKLDSDFKKISTKYEKMLRWKIQATEIAYNKKLPPEQIKQFEAKLILDYLNLKSYKIALDPQGKSLDSYQFAKIFSSYSNLDFIIGGAFGLDDSLITKVNFKLNLSKLTLPHQMAKIVLLEQIYRAQSILDNHPYHK